MSTTPEATSTPGACAVPRCQHIKANGIQCGSPALRTERHCFFHNQHRRRTYEFDPYEPVKSALNLPPLEDANSIQVVLTEVIRLVISRHIDPKSAALLLRALRLAAANVKFTSFDPRQRTHVVIDLESVENRPLGATAWSKTEGQPFDYDNDSDSDNDNNNAQIVSAPRQAKSPAANRPSQRNSNSNIFTHDEHQMPRHKDKDKDKDEAKMDERSSGALNDLLRLTIGQQIDPNYLNRPYSPAGKLAFDNALDAPTL